MLTILSLSIENKSIQSINDLLEPILTIVYIVVGVTIGRFFWRHFFYGTSHKIHDDLRQVMFQHVTSLDQAFYANQKVGGLMAYFTNDLNVIREVYGMGLLILIDGLALGSFVLFRMIELEHLMTLVAFIPIALMGVLVYFLQKKIELKAKVRSESFEGMSDFTQESFSGLTVIKAYVREMSQALFFRKKSIDVVDKTMDNVRYNILVNVLVDTMISLVILSIIAYGSILIALGQLSSG